MSRLIVITGPPGAGKSTVAAALVDGFEPSALIAGDEFFATVKRGFIAPWTGPAHHQNETIVAAAAAAAGRMTQGGYTVVYDGVIGPWFLDAFLQATGLPEAHYAMLLPSEQVCLQRIHGRVGHGFNDRDAARHMYREFADAATAIPKRQIISSARPPESVAATAADLLDRGALRVLTDS